MITVSIQVRGFDIVGLLNLIVNSPNVARESSFVHRIPINCMIGLAHVSASLNCYPIVKFNISRVFALNFKACRHVTHEATVA